MALLGRRPRLRTVLFAVNITLLLLPAGGIALLRIYESELIRRTQAELVAQGAQIRVAYKQALLEELTGQRPTRANPRVFEEFGHEVTTPHMWPDTEGEQFHPIPAEIDITSATIHPPAPDPIAASMPASTPARAAGERLTQMLREARLTTLAGIRVVDEQGTIVATTRGQLGDSLAKHVEVQRALAGEVVTLLRERTTDDPSPPLDSISRRKLIRVFVAVPIRHHNRVLGAVVLSRTPMSVLKGLYVDRSVLLIFAAILSFLVILVTAFTSLTIERPVRQLIAQTEHIAAGDDAAEPIERPVTHEFAQLSEAFAAMARTLEERGDYIKTFASNVSHEFKTPLASIRGTVELLDDHFEDMSQEERERFLGILLADAERLERLVRRLLDLARADVLQPDASLSDVSRTLDDVVSRFVEEGTEVRVEGPHALGQVIMARETFESIVSNMLENARQHGGEGVEIVVSTQHEARQGRDGVSLTIRDNGPGISSNNAARIFDAFFTTARDKGGTGLGLSVVRSLLVAHGGDIELLDVDQGAAFELWLPSARQETAKAP